MQKNKCPALYIVHDISLTFLLHDFVNWRECKTRLNQLRMIQHSRSEIQAPTGTPTHTEVGNDSSRRLPWIAHITFLGMMGIQWHHSLGPWAVNFRTNLQMQFSKPTVFFVSSYIKHQRLINWYSSLLVVVLAYYNNLKFTNGKLNTSMIVFM